MKKFKLLNLPTKPLKLEREDYFSTLKQSYPNFEQILEMLAKVER